jgi:hypothetical protein
MKRFFLLCLVVFVGAAGLAAYAPYRAFQQIRTAARAGDAEALSHRVDFPAFRQSIKDEVRSEVGQGLSGGRNLGILSGLGAVVAGAVAAPMVDAFVTPEGIAALASGERPGRRGGDDELEERKREVERSVEMSQGWEDLSTFVVRFRDRESGEQRMALVLRRDGVRWRLSALRLGADD